MAPTATEPEARQRAMIQIRHSVDARTDPRTYARVWETPPQLSVILRGDGTPHPKVQRFLVEQLAEVRATLRDSPTTPVVRLLATLYAKVDAFCREQGLPNHTRNVSIGDVDPAGLPPDIRERMALAPFGPKSVEVAARAYAYRNLFQQGGTDWQRYDLAALGWPPLRDHFTAYARQFGLYPTDVNPAETLISAGGQHGIAKALLIARRRLNEKGVANPSVYFSNPGLRMIASMGRFLGFKVLEPTASPANRFFPDATQVARELDANPDCRIYILTPMGNPNGGIADAAEVAAVLEVLKARDIIVIADFAYLGTGDIDQTNHICAVLATYPQRLDVIAMTKFFGRPGLRCSSVMTPDAALAVLFKSIAQDFQPSESYAMQAEALALWELVTWEDRRALAELFVRRQQTLIQRIREIDAARTASGKGPLIDPAQPIVGDASLYVLVPLAPGIDPLTVIEETGLIGVPAQGFFASGQTGYMRFSVGMGEV